VLVDARVADYNVDVGVVGEVFGGTVGLCVWGKVVVFDGGLGGGDAAVQEGCDGELGTTSFGMKAGKMSSRGPGGCSGGGEANDGCAEGGFAGRHGELDSGV